MDLSEQRPGDHYFLRAVSPAGIQVVDTVYTASLLLTAQRLVTDWPVTGVGGLGEDTLAPIWELEPELVILGTGTRQRFPAREVQMEFLKRQIGLEVMTLDAAARTFNVVVSEGRRAAAALIWEP